MKTYEFPQYFLIKTEVYVACGKVEQFGPSRAPSSHVHDHDTAIHISDPASLKLRRSGDELRPIAFEINSFSKDDVCIGIKHEIIRAGK